MLCCIPTDPQLIKIKQFLKYGPISKVYILIELFKNFD